MRLLVALFIFFAVAPVVAAPPNVLFINADDLNCDSLGVYGCKVPGVTPHLDRLASQGLRFRSAHVNIAVCQPCRAVWMTGRYPHRNGATGFNKINAGVPTLPEALRKAGWLTGCFAKHGHVIPSRNDAAFDVTIAARLLKNGRGIDEYRKHSAAFFDKAKAAGKPFFLMANLQDPHRPFVGSDQEASARKRDHKNKTHQYGGGFPEVGETYKPTDVTIPGFLPDIPDVRREVAEYYTSVRRMDTIVGGILDELDKAGLADNTVVMFMSDHGMALPFAKTNCWYHSTRTPWIVRWPGVVKADAVDGDHVVSGIDFTPTVLEIAGLDAIAGIDGRSVVSILRGQAQPNRDYAFTEFHQTAGRKDYPMRSVVGKKFVYIWNGWADGETVFKNESQSGRTFAAMREAAKTDPDIAARVKLFVHRVPEELYGIETDPDALQNLVGTPKLAPETTAMRTRLLEHMKKTGDPQTAAFEIYLSGLSK